MFQAPNLARPEATWRCYVQANPASFSSAPSDDWDQSAHGFISAQRLIVRDATAYGTEPNEDSWVARVNGQQSPARPTGASGVVRTGSEP